MNPDTCHVSSTTDKAILSAGTCASAMCARPSPGVLRDTGQGEGRPQGGGSEGTAGAGLGMGGLADGGGRYR